MKEIMLSRRLGTSGQIRGMLFLSLWFPWQVRGQDVQVSASVGSSEVAVQSNFQFTVTVTGPDSGSADSPKLPPMTHFRVVAGPSVSTQFQWVNGRSSSSKSFTYVLLPEAQGDFTIDPVEVSLGGASYRTSPAQVRVTDKPARGRASPAPRDPRDPFDSLDPLDPFGRRARRSGQQTQIEDEVFVGAELDRSSAFQGQQVTLTYYLYAQVSITGLQLHESPPLTGFWVEDLEVASNPRPIRKVVRGEEYFAYLIKRQALFPNTPGKLSIPPSTFAISARRSGDFFSVFSQTETVYRKSNEPVLEVRPWPDEGKPAAFTNAVGSYNLSSSLDKEAVKTGEAVVLRIRLSGRGNLKVISDLQLPPLPDFTIYSSKHEENIRALEETIIGGDKTWEYVIVPRSPGEQMIEPIEFAYFDPNKEAYETLLTSILKLSVEPGETTSGPISTLSGIGKRNVTRQGTDIHFIKLAPVALSLTSDPPYKLGWFYLVAAVPLLFNLGAFMYQRARSRDEGNQVLARRRKARRAALARLKAAERTGKEQARQFYDGASLALTGYLSDRFSLTEIEVTGDTLERTLLGKSVAAETVREVSECIQECDFGRFVSASDSSARAGALAQKIRKVIDKLEDA